MIPDGYLLRARGNAHRAGVHDMPLAGFRGRARTRAGLIAAALLASTALGGCQTFSLSSLTGRDSLTTGSIGEASFKETAEWGKKWQADKGNIDLAVGYANRLQALGSMPQALEVLGEASRRNPGEPRILAIYGKQLARAGRTAEANRVLDDALKANAKDWRLLSAKGSVLDQMGRSAEAREHYERALQAVPNEPMVINNLAMSHALAGDLKQAEALLRRAAEGKGSGSVRARQNLALVVGLQGRFDEAREILARDLPANLVEANITYIRSMLAQPNPWKKLSSLDRKSARGPAAAAPDAAETEDEAER
jgi:Flp pilus assembly protein TadD